MTSLTFFDDARVNLPSAITSKMEDDGIVSVEQVLEIEAVNPSRNAEVFGSQHSQVIAHLRDIIGPQGAETGISGAAVPPLFGVKLVMRDTVPIASSDSEISERRERVAKKVAALGEAPERIALEAWMPPVSAQGMCNSCCGHALAGARGFLAKAALSGEFSYRVAKTFDMIDGHDTGSSMQAALEGSFKVGSVGIDSYTRDDLIDRKPIEPLFPKAARLTSKGHASLLKGLDPDNFEHLPSLIMAVLNGTLIRGIGPRPVMVSTRSFEYFYVGAAYGTGLIRMPIPNESSEYGHAWVITGSVLGSHPDAPAGRPYFTVRNSWSRAWANANPLGLPGHALIPHRFFTKPNLVLEAYFLLAEPSPSACQPSSPPPNGQTNG